MTEQPGLDIEQPTLYRGSEPTRWRWLPVGMKEEDLDGYVRRVLNGVPQGLRTREVQDALLVISASNEAARTGNALVKEISRQPIPELIALLASRGMRPQQIADNLSIPYSTAYYHYKKWRDRKKTRRRESMWMRDPNTEEVRRCTAAERYKARAGDRQRIKKAKERKAKRVAKALAIAERMAARKAALERGVQ